MTYTRRRIAEQLTNGQLYPPWIAGEQPTNGQLYPVRVQASAVSATG